MIFAGDLDGALAGFGAGIAEEHAVGERELDQPLSETLLVLDPVEVRGMPELIGLLRQGRDKARMSVAKRIHGDAAGEIQIAVAGGRDQP
jgi:hypothetical protein